MAEGPCAAGLRPAIGRHPSGDGRYGFCALRARVARAIPRPQRPRPKGGKRKSPFGCGSPALQENPNARARRVAIALNARGFGRARRMGFGRRPCELSVRTAHEKVARHMKETRRELNHSKLVPSTAIYPAASSIQRTERDPACPERDQAVHRHCRRPLA